MAKPSAIDWAASAVVAKRIDALEKAFGPGETLSAEERAKVLEGIFPVFVVVGARCLRDEPELMWRCQRAMAALEDLYSHVEPRIRRLAT